MTRCQSLYLNHRIQGHPMQMFTTALLVVYLKARYPKAWALNGQAHLLRRIRNLDARNLA